MTATEHTTVTLASGVRLAMTTWHGEGPRIVALHGLGHHRAQWAAFAAAVGGRAEIVAPDLRGHGDSDVDTTGEYSVETLVSDVVELLGMVAPEGAVLVGHSLGGRVAVEIALRDLAPLQAAVVIDTSPAPSPAALRHLQRLYDAGPETVAGPADYARRLALLNPLARPEVLQPLVDAGLRRAPSGGLEEKVDRAVLRAWSAGRIRGPWAAAALASGGHRVHITLVRGDTSTVLTRATAAELMVAGLVDRVVEIPGSGHSVPLDNPEVLAETVIAAHPAVT